ncbi:TetR/AcrR family transcriptional regulator C-terminal domain-containing protein [Agromyces mediolanus]|uniref:TetR family transcriptional regulator n=1 Tax=Agromyces mediolanus TaxID=41986 RepID=A0A918CP20_AGRME|nr:TetR/AcrR family transcriptional regulator C-terminal domain-containing protein [Agromyces mediolanus]GGR33676.1 TetR family transcriptional regulator [Agromyces mediolanus]GLJ74230.1 TetR family transcriptional regulator [Agromyces mediolanus]
MNRPEPPTDPELPRGVALAWGIAAHPQRGPKRELSIERIVETAIEIADAEGLAAVSMSKVATALGFTTMSLYRYVTSKDDLVLLMQEGASLPTPPSESVERHWRAGVTAWVLAMRSTYREHPWLVDIPISGAPITPNSLQIVDWFLHEVRELPLSDGEKMSALLLLTAYVRATSAQERDLSAAGADGADASGSAAFAALAELVTPERFPSLSPLFAAGGYVPPPEEVEEDADADFTFGLERILDGLQYHLDRTAAAENAAPAGANARASEPRPEEDPMLVPPREAKVRDAAKARKEAEQKVREAEKALREARKREREAVKQAREREQHAREKELQARQKAARQS